MADTKKGETSKTTDNPNAPNIGIKGDLKEKPTNKKDEFESTPNAGPTALVKMAAR